ncbi:TonB-dependent siderophore receptor [Bradyrhizobium sp. STM 3557]|uniref:TonB-dependent siderophore receptor n=1 Tax=Bradyrhizobium sp. STM 3557 TaxID=578920 RepID=UPI00388F6664
MTEDLWGCFKVLLKVETWRLAACASSALVLGVCLAGPALAQSATVPPGRALELPSITIDSPAKRRAKQVRAPQSSRTQSASRAFSAEHRAATATPAALSGGGARGETAYGHVDGYVATRSGTGTKTDALLIETPMAVSVVTQDQMRAQAVQNIPQAVRYTSGARAETTGADGRFDYVYVRGFLADLYLDGMRMFTTGFSTSIIDPYSLERLEVLHGPASILYGQASPGGLVEMISKRPTEDPYREMFLSTGSYGRVQGGVDLSGPIDKDKQFLYRLTAQGFDVGTQVDDTKYKRVMIAPSLTWRPDNQTTITFLGTHQNDPNAGFFNLLPKSGIGTLFPLPNGQYIPTSFYPGVPSVDHESRERSQIGYLAEHRFDNLFAVRQNVRYTDITNSITTIYPNGQPPRDPNSLARSAFTENEHLRTFQIDNQLEAKFALGPFTHTTLFGVDYQNGNYGNRSGSGSAPEISVTNPNYNTPISIPFTSTNRQNFDQVGLYAQDEIKLDHWVALLDLRWDRATQNSLTQSLSTGATTASSQTSNDALTKRGALLYKFDNGIAPYIQYTESFQPQITGLVRNGNSLVPTTGQQEEAGIKYQPDAKFLYSVAAFNLLQQHVTTPDLSNPLYVVQTGAIRSRGIELEGKTEINRSLSLLASYTYLDQVITRTNVAGATGRHPVGMPMHSASLWADYTFHGGQLDGFGIAGGIRYLGDSAGNTAGASVLNVPAVTLFDAAVHYDFSALGPKFKGYSLQVNATNLFDKTYVTLCQDTGCYYGLRREVIATLRYRW